MSGRRWCEEHPDVGDVPVPLMPTGQPTALRRSPRKKASGAVDLTVSPTKKDSPQNPSVASKKAIPAKSASQSAKGAVQASVGRVPSLSRHPALQDITATSNNRRSPAKMGAAVKLTHVDSFLMPGSRRKGVSTSRTGDTASKGTDDGLARELVRKPAMSRITAVARRQQTSRSNHASRFVMQEAHCNDDSDESNGNDDGEDEDTDLSGFIVSDDAELSFHDSSAGSEDEETATQRRPTPTPPRRRRLVRGSPVRRKLSFATHDAGADSDCDREGEGGSADVDQLARVLGQVNIEDSQPSTSSSEIEVIDLTSSPVTLPRRHEPSVNPSTVSSGWPPVPGPHTQHPFDDFDAVLKFSPPPSRPALAIPSKSRPGENIFSMPPDENPAATRHEECRTPPATPPRSPSKLKSPSKLLSPSKRKAIPQSPHRQSMDAFWDHNVVNEWNDVYSPKKAPASPDKLSRFQLWSDSDDESDGSGIGEGLGDCDTKNDIDNNNDNDDNDDSSSLPSPCSSPRKSHSPRKATSPSKSERDRVAEEKKAAKQRKAAFEARKHQLAADLLRELDTHVTHGQLATLAASTGGVQLLWSKTLRTTAGRANWKRTVVKSAPGSRGSGSGDGVTITTTTLHHHASIELASKIIDNETRLVNTLAHEFCHLANFMVSGVRDQPHGASFKAWAARATTHLRASERPLWRDVRVTTKHDYVIEYKYLWVCAGRRPQKTSLLPLSLSMPLAADPSQSGGHLDDGDEGARADACGAEYGRHSKSIDVEKHRCGRCRGLLVQVRPKPRASPQKKGTGFGRGGVGRSREGSSESADSGSGSRSGGGSRSGSASESDRLDRAIEVVELSD